jgi:hypothetical protein
MADLSPAELAALSRQLELLIEQARSLQQQIAERAVEQRNADRPDRSGEPAAIPRSKSRRRRSSPKT